MSPITICGEEFNRETTHFSFQFEFDKQYDMEELHKLQYLPRLTSASFNSTNFDDFGIKQLAKHAPGLTNLNLQDTLITDHGIKYLSPLKGLSILRLKENDQLTNACVPGLNLCRALTDLQIHETSIDQKGLAMLNLPELEQLLVSEEADFSMDFFKGLSLRMPQCNILVKSRAEFENGLVLWGE